MIERIAMTMLRIEMMDAAALRDKDGSLTERQGRGYLAWSNSCRRMVAELGMKSVPTKTPGIAELMAAE